MNENILGKKISLIASELGHRIFRCNNGQGWIGKSVRVSQTMMVQVHPGDVIIRQARPLHAGLINGSGDYIGFSSNGKFISLELKTKTGAVRPEQISWVEAVKNSGGIAGICRSEEDAFELLS